MQWLAYSHATLIIRNVRYNVISHTNVSYNVVRNVIRNVLYNGIYNVIYYVTNKDIYNVIHQTLRDIIFNLRRHFRFAPSYIRYRHTSRETAGSERNVISYALL